MSYHQMVDRQNVVICMENKVYRTNKKKKKLNDQQFSSQSKLSIFLIISDILSLLIALALFFSKFSHIKINKISIQISSNIQLALGTSLTYSECSSNFQWFFLSVQFRQFQRSLGSSRDLMARMQLDAM